MGAMRYKPSDKVRIKNLDWYNENKDKRGFICFDYTNFIPEMSQYCGEILTINQVVEEYEHYRVSECAFSWTDEMIEGLVEEENKVGTALNPIELKSNANCLTREMIEEFTEEENEKKLSDESWRYKNIFDSSQYPQSFELPEGYIFKDENGNVINATKIVLEKKKKEYPKTYEECCKVLGIDTLGHSADGYKWEILSTFQNLLICRDAYWKIAGEEMGLGKPWEPDWSGNNAKYSIYTIKGVLTKATSCYDGAIFTFPTEEMRDAFYENFKNEIESCKELL